MRVRPVEIEMISWCHGRVYPSERLSRRLLLDFALSSGKFRHLTEAEIVRNGVSFALSAAVTSFVG